MSQITLTQEPTRKRKMSRQGSYTSKRSKKGLKRLGQAPQIGRMSRPRQRVILRYTQEGTLASAAASGTQVFRANSCFDPDLTGTGSQPVGFDQWSAFYNRYIVYKCFVEFKIANRGAIGGTFGVHATNQDTNVDVATLASQPDAKFYQMGLNTGFDIVDDKMMIRLWILNGRTFRDYMADDRHQAAIGANPSELGLWRMRWDSYAGGAATVHYIVRLSYYVEFFDTIQLALS